MMKREPSPHIPLDDDEGQKSVHFILPAFVSALGFSCAREYADDRIGFHCGCPRCLRKDGLALVFHPDDYQESGDMREHWRKRIVSVKTAGYASHLICPGYEPEA